MASYKQIVLIDKPRGISSNDALGMIKKIIRGETRCRTRDLPKIGHGGTLDPLATGLLVVGITRSGTRQLQTAIEHDKTYECVIDLLKSSKTGDLEDYTQERFSGSSPDDNHVKSVLSSFVGTITQTPPIYSALKINGTKACDLARAGEEIVMKSRIITIYSIELIRYEFPILEIRVSCSKGTYIRTLGMDIGNELGLYGTLLRLHRIRSGDYEIADAYALDELTYNDLLEVSDTKSEED